MKIEWMNLKVEVLKYETNEDKMRQTGKEVREVRKRGREGEDKVKCLKKENTRRWIWKWKCSHVEIKTDKMKQWKRERRENRKERLTGKVEDRVNW